MAERITIKQAAEIMGKSEQFVRIGLQRGLLPFGVAVKKSTTYSYYISPRQFYEYVGMQEGLDALKKEIEEQPLNIIMKVIEEVIETVFAKYIKK